MRALLKCGLECAWIDHGDAMLAQRYDHLRAAVLGSPSEGVLTRDRHASQAATTFAMAVLLDYLGVRLTTLSQGLQAASNLAVDTLGELAVVVGFTAADAA